MQKQSITAVSNYLSCLILCCVCFSAFADETSPSRAHYLGNAGTVIEHGGFKIAFDPLFRNDYGAYDLVPVDIEASFMAGAAPWDGIDAVFISHHHEDHFDPALILELLTMQTGIELYAPEQAAVAIRTLISEPNDPVLNRVHGLAIEYGSPAIDLELGTIVIEAIGIPHSGWPSRHKEVQNIVFRITLDDEATVMHFGDADANDEHFASNSNHWKKRHTHFAMPPYWFYFSDEGRQILDNRIDATHTIGLHVPKKMPYDPESRPDELQGVDLFRRQGETRNITITN